jgi:hypothetical protein
MLYREVHTHATDLNVCTSCNLPHPHLGLPFLVHPNDAALAISIVTVTAPCPLGAGPSFAETIPTEAAPVFLPLESWGGWPIFADTVTTEAAPAFLRLESWAPRTSMSARHAIFRTLISAFRSSFTRTTPGAGPSFAETIPTEAAPAFLPLESWAPRTLTPARHPIFRTLISAFRSSFTSTAPRSPSA